MFRRKEEDSLFDTADASAPRAPQTESANVISSQSIPAASAPSAPSAYAPASASAMPRPPSAATPVGGFRTSASPLGSDITRSRMPESKPAASSQPQAAEKGIKPGRRVLTVGNDILLKGEIATCDRLVIEGKVDATLNDVHTVEIAEGGSFKGSAHIEDAEISGLFEGDLVVRNRLVIYSTGKVRGKITYGEIEIERGGELTGEIKSSNAQPSSSARPARQSAKEDSKVAA